MKKRVVLVFPLVLALGCAEDPDTNLRTKYPFGLLSSTHGIVNETDLSLYAQEAFPLPLSPANLSSLYWQCFPAAAVTPTCEPFSFDDNLNCRASLGQIIVRDGAITHTYIDRRPSCVHDCQMTMQLRKALLLGEPYACLGGSSDGLEKEPGSPPNHVWIFDKLKTKKGCDSWWAGHCDSRSAIAALARETYSGP